MDGNPLAIAHGGTERIALSRHAHFDDVSCIYIIDLVCLNDLDSVGCARFEDIISYLAPAR